MSKIICSIIVLLACIARISEATEVIITVDRLVYAGKEYSARVPTIYYTPMYRTGRDYISPGLACIADPQQECDTPARNNYLSDQVKGLASLMMARSASGLGWYGVTGLWRWWTMKLRKDAELECFNQDGSYCWWRSDEDFTPQAYTVVYAGGGLQYRFDWSQLSLTPFAGVVGHWPRIESVSGTTHLYHLGLRAGMKISAHSELLIQYSHFSNGNRLRLADRTIANQGIEAISLGVSYRF